MRVYVPDPERGDAYPIVTLTWVMLYRQYADANKTAALGYTPLPPTIQRRSLAALAGLRASVQ